MDDGIGNIDYLNHSTRIPCLGDSSSIVHLFCKRFTLFSRVITFHYRSTSPSVFCKCQYKASCKSASRQVRKILSRVSCHSSANRQRVFVAHQPYISLPRPTFSTPLTLSRPQYTPSQAIAGSTLLCSFSMPQQAPSPGPSTLHSARPLPLPPPLPPLLRSHNSLHVGRPAPTSLCHPSLAGPGLQDHGPLGSQSLPCVAD
jgi:hypothetical protein